MKTTLNKDRINEIIEILGTRNFLKDLATNTLTVFAYDKAANDYVRALEDINADQAVIDRVDVLISKYRKDAIESERSWNEAWADSPLYHEGEEEGL